MIRYSIRRAVRRVLRKWGGYASEHICACAGGAGEQSAIGQIMDMVRLGQTAANGGIRAWLIIHETREMRTLALAASGGGKVARARVGCG